MSNLSYLSEYQTFNNTQELNYNVSQHEKAHQDELNATDRSILRFIARYSVKYSGASHLKVATIAEAIEKSVRTVNYVLKRLEENRIIKRISRMRRKSGGNGANIIQILPYIAEPVAHRQDSDKATEPRRQPSISENEPLCNRYIPNTHTRDGIDGKRALRTAIPTPIYKAIEPFFDAKGMYDTYGILLRAKASVDTSRSITLEEYAEEYTDEFLNIIRKYKRREVRSLPGLLYVAWQRVTAEISRRRTLAAGRGLASLFAEVMA